MESNTKKYSLEDFPSLIEVVCDSISTDKPNREMLLTCSQIIYSLSESENIITLINFWKNDVPEDTPLLTKAIMYKCLYIIYHSFSDSDYACFLLMSLSEKSEETS